MSQKVNCTPVLLILRKLLIQFGMTVYSINSFNTTLGVNFMIWLKIFTLKPNEIVSNYTYLGINFSSNGNFKTCEVNLKDKVRRSFFATRRYLDFSKVPIDITNKLFNSLFLPTLLYGSEIWGIYDKDDFNSWEKDVTERTHIFLCKQSLGVNKQCPNVAARNELGRLHLRTLPDIFPKRWLINSSLD